MTGSKHVLEVGDVRVLFDCGLFQGLPDIRERNRSLPWPPESISMVVLSHAHLDHCGMLPLLVKRGFTGPIFTTPATKDVASHMLADMAGIEEQDAEYRQRHHIGPPDEREPLITREDIGPVLKQMVAVPYARGGGWHEMREGWRLKFYDAGHILGSAMSVVEFADESGEVKRVCYTGDVGPKGQPLMRDPEVPEEEVGTVLMESTYGSRDHRPLKAAEERLAQTIKAVCERKGKMIVPAFSLGRTQEFVYVVHKLTDEGRIPRFPIYVDSPLASDITKVYRAHAENYDTESEKDFAGHDHRPLAFRNLQYTQSVMESKQLNSAKGPLMIISASGMMTAGRVVHHLRHSIADKRNAVFVTGYQAQGTPGRRILEGARWVELYGDRIPVKAEIATFNEFSAHADRRELQQLVEAMLGVKRVALVHGEASQADEFVRELSSAHPEWEVTRPDEGDVVEV